MLKWLRKKMTNDFTEVPLIIVTFDNQRYVANGRTGSCDIQIHPSLKGDSFIQDNIELIIDHIRDKYDMEELL